MTGVSVSVCTKIGQLANHGLLARLVDHLHGFRFWAGVADSCGAKHLGQVTGAHLGLHAGRYPVITPTPNKD